MKKRAGVLLLVLAMVLMTLSPAFALDLPDKEQHAEIKVSDGPVRIIVELEQPSIVHQAKLMGTTYSALSTDQVDVMTEARLETQEAVKSEIEAFIDDAVFKNSYTTAYNGFSMEADYEDIEKIEALDGVVSVHISKKYALPEPQLITSTGMVHAPYAWDTAGYEGEGMLVAVIDSGIDFEHDDFVLTNPVNAKLSLDDVGDLLSGKELKAEAFNETALPKEQLYKSSKVPFAYDYADHDTDAKPDMSKDQASEHGVHVSGIVGANGTLVKGVAPEAQIAGMKVFSDNDKYAYEEDIVAGIEDAIAIGADVINMSLGSVAGFVSDEDPDQKAILSAKEAGIVVAVSAGNSGRFGDDWLGYTFPWFPDTGLVGSPSVGNGTLSVASSENLEMNLSYFTTEEDKRIGYKVSSGPDIAEAAGTMPIEFVLVPGYGEMKDYEDIDVENKVALVKRGELDFTVKIQNAYDNHAKAIIIYNNAGEELVSMQYEDYTIPAVFITQSDGEALAALSEDGKNEIVFSNGKTDFFENYFAGEISSFSSWGPSASLTMKPEITAPGGNIYSTVNDDKYEVMSGTSMAAPHIAGASALMLEYIYDPAGPFDFDATDNTDLSKAADLVKNLMMSTADVLTAPNDVYYSPRQQGAGQLDLEKALKTEAYVYDSNTKVSKVELGETGETFSFDLTVDNFGVNDQQYILSGSAQTDYIQSQYFAGDVEVVGLPQNLSDAVITVEASNETPNILNEVTYTSPGGYQIVPDGEAETINIVNLKSKVESTSTALIVLEVGAGETSTITVTVDLTDALDAPIYDMATLGLFADGFVEFIPMSDDNFDVSLSIPYLGFVGDWEDLQVFDNDVYYDEGYSYYGGIYFLYGSDWVSDQAMASVTYDAQSDSVDYNYLGYNFISDEFDPDWIAFSPNGDSYKDKAGLIFSAMRNIEGLTVSLYKDNGNGEFDSGDVYEGYISGPNEVPKISKQNDGVTSYYPITADEEYKFGSLSWDGTMNGEPVEEGQYFYVVDAKPVAAVGNENDTTIQTYVYPVYVDITNPEIKRAYLDKSTNKLTVNVTDNHEVSTYVIFDADDNVIALSADGTFDVTGLTLTDASLYVEDYAENVDTVMLDSVVQIINPNSGGSSGGGSFSGGGSPAPATGDDEDAEVGVINENGVQKMTVSATAVASAIKEAAQNQLKQYVLKAGEDFDPAEPADFEIPTEILKALADEDIELVLEIGGVAFTLSSELFADSSNPVTVKMVPTTNESTPAGDGFTALGTAYEFEVYEGGTEVGQFKGKMKVAIDTPEGAVSPEKVGVYRINEDGSMTFVMTYYDPETGKLSFNTPHFSSYALIRYDKTFDDIQGHWAQNFIEEMASKYVTTGVTETAFEPERSITRAEFSAMVIKAIGETAEGTPSFADVTASDWYAPYLATAEALGLVHADQSSSFRPMEDITREEMAVIIAKAHAILNNVDLEDHRPAITFSDSAKISTENLDYVGYAEETGIVTGYQGQFMPLNDATRAEALAMIRQMLYK